MYVMYCDGKMFLAMRLYICNGLINLFPRKKSSAENEPFLSKIPSLNPETKSFNFMSDKIIPYFTWF